MKNTYTVLPYRKFHDASTSFKSIAKEPVLIIIKDEDNKKAHNNQLKLLTKLYRAYMESIDKLEKAIFSNAVAMITAMKKEYKIAKNNFQNFLANKEISYMNQFDYDKIYRDNETRKMLNEKTAFQFFPYISLTNSEMNMVQSCLAK